ncbi:MAG: hypothetical protein QXN68_04005 [Thermoplasmata archaeon]
MTNDEFKKHFSILLKSAINYARLYAVQSYLEYYRLKKHTKSILSYMNNNEISEVIKQYEREMKYYDNLSKELETLLFKELESEDLNEKFKIMKLFNELMYVL